jgi:hypothetical protein
MKIKDLTKEQTIEIAKLIYPFSDTVEGEYEFSYQPYDPTWYEDAREYVQLKFKGVTFGTTIDTLIFQINKNLDCWFYYSRDSMYTLPSRNQHAIQKKFIEWGIEPDYTK